MDILSTLSSTHLLLLVTIPLLASMFVGDALRRVWEKRGYTLSKNQAHLVQLAALLAFGVVVGLIAYTSLERREARIAAVVEEAGSIRGAWLMSDVLPSEDRQETKQALKLYTQSRIEIGNTPFAKRPQVLAKSDKAYDALRRTGVVLSEGERGAFKAAYTSALIEIQNRKFERNSALSRGLPLAAIIALGVTYLTFGVGFGFANGGTQQKPEYFNYAFLALIATLLFFVIDFDRPHRGAFQVSNAPLEQVLSSMEKGYAQSAAYRRQGQDIKYSQIADDRHKLRFE